MIQKSKFSFFSYEYQVSLANVHASSKTDQDALRWLAVISDKVNK